MMDNQMCRIVQSRAVVRRSSRGRCVPMSVREAHGCCDEWSMKLAKRPGLNQGRRDYSVTSMARDISWMICRINPCMVGLRVESRLQHLQLWQCVLMLGANTAATARLLEAGTSPPKRLCPFPKLPRMATYLVQNPGPNKTWQSELNSPTSQDKTIFAD